MIGVLPIDKPEGPTSHDVVAAARRALGVRRIGHTGTLDPFATGLLLLCVGPATRIAEYFGGLKKAYAATARLGVETDTLDRTGVVTATSGGWQEVDEDGVRRAFDDQVGRRLQAPPAYSAKKIAGRRAYELARDGQDVAPAPVEVEIHELRVVGFDPDHGLVRFEITCSTGTYVRAVARDAGHALGVGAHLTELRRTAIGGFSVDRALPFDGLGDAAAVNTVLVPPLEALAHLPLVRLEEGEEVAVRHGRGIPARGRAPKGTVVLAAGGQLIAVAASDGTSLQPRKVLG
jgi:tRNA pseudouridine55 synthase